MAVVVRDSCIEGKGVFATRDFKKGETVIKWDTSKQITPAEAELVSETEKRYLAYRDGKIIVQQTPAKYVNHCCDPNTHVVDFCDVALRDIKAGEEVTSDYSNDLAPDETMPCHCGSRNCKKTIKRK
ncbi:MAG: SET domain-containing protein-lysine N-methyltransferase [Candidatus Bathyarchaeota archaeon]|nr:SET domain-containing protein-lysine N-methyltransferase [Candidatus Bathyarchaeota archaeon]